jgi:hypothetical protein
MDIYDKAMTWIRQWKLVGGGFDIRLTPSGPAVQLLRKVDENPATDKIIAATADKLERRLRERPELHAAVCELAATAWQRRTIANDQDNPDPPEAA